MGKIAFYKTPLSKLGLILISLTFIFSNCHKDDVISPQNSTGNISGSIIPSNSAFVVRASSGNSIYSAAVDATGNYTISSVPYGTYSVQAYPVGGYNKPNSVSVSVNSSSNPQSPINLTASNNDGNMTYTLNGTNYSLYYPYTSAAYNGIGVNGFLISSQTNINSVDHWTIRVTLNNFNGVGSYPVSNAPNSTFDILKYVGSTISLWSTSLGGNATINVNTMDTTSHRISGTFTVSAMPVSNASGIMTISNGTFNNLYYTKN
jgi:hypothetical protein